VEKGLGETEPKSYNHLLPLQFYQAGFTVWYTLGIDISAVSIQVLKHMKEKQMVCSLPL